METLTQAKRLVPGLGDGRRASANAYLALIGVIGVVGWGTTALLRHFVSLERVYFWGSEVFGLDWAGAVAVGWVALYGVRMLVGFASVDRGVTLSLPEVVWSVLVALAFGATFWAFTLDITQFRLRIDMMWLPWMAAFAVGYLFTGSIVDRGGVYLAAGAVAAAGVAAEVLGTTPPYPLVVLGALHAAPMLIDAARGGRQLTEEGVPELTVDPDADEAGGVVTS
jgi:hypothetical protein